MAAPESLRLTDYSDRELLRIVDRLADSNSGWATSADIAEAG